MQTDENWAWKPIVQKGVPLSGQLTCMENHLIKTHPPNIKHRPETMVQ